MRQPRPAAVRPSSPLERWPTPWCRPTAHRFFPADKASTDETVALYRWGGPKQKWPPPLFELCAMMADLWPLILHKAGPDTDTFWLTQLLGLSTTYAVSTAPRLALRIRTLVQAAVQNAHWRRPSPTSIELFGIDDKKPELLWPRGRVFFRSQQISWRTEGRQRRSPSSIMWQNEINVWEATFDVPLGCEPHIFYPFSAHFLYPRSAPSCQAAWGRPACRDRRRIFLPLSIVSGGLFSSARKRC
jgi:hypothetical protein